MTHERFDSIYSQLIAPSARTLAWKLNSSGKTVTFVNVPDRVFDEYQKQKTFFRMLCNKTHHDSNSCNLLDRHKVCAALCVAIIKVGLIQHTDIPNDDIQDIAMFHKYNEQLAISLALDLLGAFIHAEYIKKTDPIPFLNTGHGYKFIFPRPQNPNEVYEDTIVRSIYFANTVGQLNLHLIAHIFFQIEQYHMLYREYQDFQSTK